MKILGIDLSYGIATFGFLLIFISILLIFYLMSISKKIGLDLKNWLKYFLISFILLYLILIILCWNATSWLNPDVFSISIPSAISFIFLSILLSFGYVFIFKKKEIPKEYKQFYDDLIKRLPVAMTIFSVLIMFLVTMSINWTINEINEYNKIEPPTFEESVKAGIFFYGNETNPYGVNISMYVLNQNPDFYYDEVIFILAFKNESYNLTIRKKEGMYDLTGADDFNITRGVKRTWKFRDDKKYSNYTKIVWNSTTHKQDKSYYLQGGIKNFPLWVYANYTVNYTEKDKMIYYDEIRDARVILKKYGEDDDKFFDYNPVGSEYHLKILDFGFEPDIKIEDGSPNMVNVFNQIKNSN